MEDGESCPLLTPLEKLVFVYIVNNKSFNENQKYEIIMLLLGDKLRQIQGGEMDLKSVRLSPFQKLIRRITACFGNIADIVDELYKPLPTNPEDRKGALGDYPKARK